MSFESEISNWKYSRILKNDYKNFNKDNIFNYLSKNEIDEAFIKISSWNNYSPTPLLSLNQLSNKLNLKNIFYKDESKRFHLKSFKALGRAYAVEKVTKGKKKL